MSCASSTTMCENGFSSRAAADSDVLEKRGWREEGALPQRLPNPDEDLPQRLSLLRAKPVLPAHARHVRVSVGAVDVPGIDDVLPLRKQEARREAGDACSVAACSTSLRTLPPVGKMGLATCGQRIELLGDAPERCDGDEVAASSRRPPARIASLLESSASGSEKVVEARRHGSPRRMRMTRWSATTVLPVPRGACHAHRAGIVALNHLPLERVEEHGPFLEGSIEGSLQLLDAVENAETAHRVRMDQRVSRAGARVEDAGQRHIRAGLGPLPEAGGLQVRRRSPR